MEHIYLGSGMSGFCIYPDLETKDFRFCNKISNKRSIESEYNKIKSLKESSDGNESYILFDVTMSPLSNHQVQIIKDIDVSENLYKLKIPFISGNTLDNINVEKMSIKIWTHYLKLLLDLFKRTQNLHIDNIYHGDIRPENIILREKFFLVDFERLTNDRYENETTEIGKIILNFIKRNKSVSNITGSLISLNKLPSTIYKNIDELLNIRSSNIKKVFNNLNKKAKLEIIELQWSPFLKFIENFKHLDTKNNDFKFPLFATYINYNGSIQSFDYIGERTIENIDFDNLKYSKDYMMLELKEIIYSDFYISQKDFLLMFISFMYENKIDVTFNIYTESSEVSVTINKNDNISDEDRDKNKIIMLDDFKNIVENMSNEDEDEDEDDITFLNTYRVVS